MEGVALIGIINATPSHAHRSHHLPLPSALTFTISGIIKDKKALCKKRDPPLTDIIITTFYQKVQTCFLSIHLPPPYVSQAPSFTLSLGISAGREKERKGEKERESKKREGKKARLSSVNWSECTTKSGFTTKVSRSDCQYCQRNGVLGRGGSKGGGDTKVRWWGRQEGLL